MKIPAVAVVATSLAVLLVAAPGALAAPATAAPATTDAAAAKADEPSAAERRAAKSEFEREKLDSSAFEEEGASGKGDAPKEKDSGSDAGSIGRMLFGLVVVLGAIFGVHWLLRKWGESRMQGVVGRSGMIDVVATTSLAQNRSLHLVRVGEEIVLVGATEQSITRLGEVDATVLSQAAGDLGKSEFQAMLQGSMLGNQPGVPAGMGGAGSTDQPFLRRFIDNLRLSTAR